MFLANLSMPLTVFSVKLFPFIAVIRMVHISPIPQMLRMIQGKKSIMPEIPISCAGLSIHSFVMTRLIHVLLPSLDVSMPVSLSVSPFVKPSLRTERNTILMLIANVTITGRKTSAITLLTPNFSRGQSFFPNHNASASTKIGENAIIIQSTATLIMRTTHSTRRGNR